MTGREFENQIIKELHKAGYWVHWIHPDKTGQQPFDIIAMKGNRVCVYDAKVVSDGHRFPFNRIEDNQFNSFRLIEKKTSAVHVGILIHAENKIRYMDISRINSEMSMGRKSVDINQLPEWRAL